MVDGSVLLVNQKKSVPKCALAFDQLITDAGSPAGDYTNLFLSKDHFFFQADDGIRGLYVTGVQTCALPISARLVGDVYRTACAVSCATHSGSRCGASPMPYVCGFARPVKCSRHRNAMPRPPTT